MEAIGFNRRQKEFESVEPGSDRNNKLKASNLPNSISFTKDLRLRNEPWKIAPMEHRSDGLRERVTTIGSAKKRLSKSPSRHLLIDVEIPELLGPRQSSGSDAGLEPQSQGHS